MVWQPARNKWRYDLKPTEAPVYRTGTIPSHFKPCSSILRNWGNSQNATVEAIVASIAFLALRTLRALCWMETPLHLFAAIASSICWKIWEMRTDHLDWLTDRQTNSGSNKSEQSILPVAKEITLCPKIFFRKHKILGWKFPIWTIYGQNWHSEHPQARKCCASVRHSLARVAPFFCGPNMLSISKSASVVLPNLLTHDAAGACWDLQLRCRFPTCLPLSLCPSVEKCVQLEDKPSCRWWRDRNPTCSSAVTVDTSLRYYRIQTLYDRI